jgi:transcriptional regulator with XRE-family HTH domain
MTQPLLPGSPRKKAAERFGTLLDRAMRRAKVGQVRLGEVAGVAPSSIANYRCGGNLPRIETAQRLAAALSEPQLVDIVLQSRNGECETCRKPFTNQGGGPKRFCSQECRDVKARLREGKGVRGRAIVAERRLADHVVAVTEMCRRCEPEGLCRDMECPLRAVSPLPLARADNEVLPATPAAGAWGDYEKKVASVREANARRWNREGERERASALNAARWAAMTEAERAEYRRKISEGRRKAA